MASETAMEKREEVVAVPEHVRAGRSYRPNVDIIEREDELLLMADIPGVKADDININYENGQLSLHAKVDPRQDEASTEYLVREYGVGDFYRNFQVGEGIDPSRIEADVKNGVLTLRLPKAEAVKPRKIAVKPG